MELKHLAQEDFEKEVLESKKPVIVDFFATWCGPCKMLGPILEEVADETKNVTILKVDIDENMELAQKFGIMSVPTLMIFKDGQEIGREIGFKPKDQVLEIIKSIK